MIKRAQKSPLIALALDRSLDTPLQTQAFDQIRDAILRGRLAPGARLPSSRVLAAEQGISRNTVLAAYDRLFGEGYVEGRTGSGTRVSRVLPEDLLTARNNPARAAGRSDPAGKISGLNRRLGGLGSRRTALPARAFRPGVPDLDNFPFAHWSRLTAKFWRRPPADLLVSGDLAGYRPLRDAIAAYLGAVRGVHCSGDQVMVTSGAQQGLDLIARVLIDPGDRVWVEDPGYAGLRGAFLAAGAELVDVSVDGEGLSVEGGRGLDPNAVLAAVTPSHQYPTGVTMTLARRLELLNWAADAGAWILEDDHDSEFRYGGRPLSALQGLDGGSRVIYAGTFSKVLFPALRLGYLVLPEALVDPFLKVRAALDDQPSIAVQPVLAQFIEDGQFAAHIRRMRALYEERQESLIRVIRAEADGLLNAKASGAGMHLVASMGPRYRADDKAASRQLADAGIIAPALSGYYAGTASGQGLVLGYAGLTERDMAAAMRKAAKVLVNLMS